MVPGHRANRGILGDERWRRPRRRTLDQLANGLIPKVLVSVRLRDGGKDALARMPARESKDALNEPNGADATGRERRVGPLPKRRADALTLADQAIDKGVLTRRGLGLTSARGKYAGCYARVHHDERVALEDAHEMRIPAHADALAQQRERHRIEGPRDFDVTIGVDGALAGREIRKRVECEGLQGSLLDLHEVRPHLTSRGPVNPQTGDRAIPVPQKRIVGVETVEAPALQGIAFDVTRRCAPACRFPAGGAAASARV